MAKEYTAKPTPDTTEDQNALTTNEAAQVLSPVAGKPQRLIYCGPNLSGGFLQRYMVSKGGLPIHLDSLFASCPAIKSLFVPVADLAKTEKWFKRNCNDVVGRECSASEKANVLAWLLTVK